MIDNNNHNADKFLEGQTLWEDPEGGITPGLPIVTNQQRVITQLLRLSSTKCFIIFQLSGFVSLLAMSLRWFSLINPISRHNRQLFSEKKSTDKPTVHS